MRNVGLEQRKLKAKFRTLNFVLGAQPPNAIQLLSSSTLNSRSKINRSLSLRNSGNLSNFHSSGDSGMRCRSRKAASCVQIHSSKGTARFALFAAEDSKVKLPNLFANS